MGQGKATDVQVKEVSVSFEPVQFRAPLKFGGRIVSSSYLINAEVTVDRIAESMQPAMEACLLEMSGPGLQQHWSLIRPSNS